jgi:hypothetical protein
MKKIILSFAIVVLASISSMAQQQGENLKIVWPEEYKWVVGSNQEDKSVHMMELIPGNETLQKWTMMGNMLSIKGAKNVPMDVAVNMTFEQAKQQAPKAKLTVIEKDEKAKNPWVLFKIEAPNFLNDKNPESQLYYIIQGNDALYSNFIALKEKTLKDDFVAKWTKVFKASEIVYN